MDVLERERKGRLVPALILYHPTEDVVTHALALFVRAAAQERRPRHRSADRHESPRIRAAAIAARSALAHDARLLNLRLSMEDSPEVRATIA